MIVFCFFLAFPLFTFLCTVIWLGMVLRIRAAFRRYEEGEQVLAPSQLGALNVASAVIAGAGGLLGIGPFVVAAYVYIKEPYFYASVASPLVVLPPAGSALVGGALTAGGLVAFAVHSGKIAELYELDTL